ncbi:hypothetical protein [Pseudomonas sp. LS-2]|uniref:hypothetical protein n=1 Tax=Pseudomonas sp. LS-2 TaxID=2315859 RepID=UPI00140496E9|nr:hypothetical protein [Pseudomonas sp. LS-2]
MNNQRLAATLLKAGLNSVFVQIQTGLTPDQVLISRDRKVSSIRRGTLPVPRIEDILASPSKSAFAAGLLLIYTADATDWQRQVDPLALLSAYESYLQEHIALAAKDAPSPLSLDEAWVLCRELRCDGETSLQNRLISSIIKGH